VIVFEALILQTRISMKQTWRRLATVALISLLAACNGSGAPKAKAVAAQDHVSAADDAVVASTVETDAPPASVSLQASETAVFPGDSVTLTWSSSNADSCSASGGWSGEKATSGSQSVGPLQQDTSFTLSCTGAGGGGLRQVTVQVDNGNGVSVSLSANPSQVPVNGSSTLAWTSANATSCVAAGGWSGSQALSGSFVTAGLTENTNYQMTCDGPSGNAVSMVMVEVLDKILRWQAPTQNVDGSALNDLDGYRVYWGAQSRNYSGSVSINSPTTTQWEATNAPGTYYFALTAFDTDGNESAYSNEVLKTIP